MSGELRYRTDLYAGTAPYYDAFRPSYPQVLLDDLRARVPVRDTSRVLDLACGTGQIAFALAAHVAEVVAVDQEQESVAFAERKARQLGVSNVHFVAAPAESVALDGSFDLVAIGNAFHRLDRDAVAHRLVPHLRERGCIALCWSRTPSDGDRPWQHALREAFERWMDAVGARDRIPANWEQVMKADPHEQVLRRAGLVYEGQFEFTVTQQWTVESLIGFAYSTSFLSRAALGDRTDEFERDLRSRLQLHAPAGGFEQDLSFAYEVARRPA